MARKSHNHRLDLPPLELECMAALWGLGQATVHEIRARLFAKRPLAYTTVMTVMDRLARKGLVERQKRGRAHLYHPIVSEDLVRDRAIARLVDNFFQGSREQLQQYLKTGESTSMPSLPEAAGAGKRPTARKTPGVPATAAAEENLDTTLL